MKHHIGKSLAATIVLASATLALGISVASADDIVIGASLPLSGPLAGFGSFQQWGYKRAVDEINKAGGIAINGTKQQIKLIIRDDKTDPNATASNTETLISRDRVTAMLGSCTPSVQRHLSTWAPSMCSRATRKCRADAARSEWSRR